MKLAIVESCIVAAGKVAERGSVYDTGNDDPISDKLAYSLIITKRALPMELYTTTRQGLVEPKGENPEAVTFLKQFRDETAKAAEAAKAAKAEAAKK